MEYHEIGERFEYNGVVLEVVKGMSILDCCEKCYFSLLECLAFQNTLCNKGKRLDGNLIYYKLVEQCKPKDNNNMENTIIYYADLDPCDNMNDYKELAFVPQFVLDDDTEPPICVVQLATRLGWCIVAKWCNNGFTRIYALEDETVKEGIEIVQGHCAWYECSDVKEIHSKNVKNKDISVFNGYASYGGVLDKSKDMEQKTEIKVDNVNHPAHYNSHPSGIECIEIARHHNFNIGNAIKYLWRAGLKSEKGMEDADKQVEDLRKAIFYINDEIERIKSNKRQ